MPLANSVLIIDDDADIGGALQFALRRDVPEVVFLQAPVQAERIVSSNRFDAVLLDMNFSSGERRGEEGIKALEVILTADPCVSVILMTAYGGVSLAVEALKRGGFDFLLKPWNHEKLLQVIDAAARKTAERRVASCLTLEDLERNAISRTLGRENGNISKTAAALGLTRPALYRKLEKHGL